MAGTLLERGVRLGIEAAAASSSRASTAMIDLPILLDLMVSLLRVDSIPREARHGSNSYTTLLNLSAFTEVYFMTYNLRFYSRYMVSLELSHQTLTLRILVGHLNLGTTVVPWGSLRWEQTS